MSVVIIKIEDKEAVEFQSMLDKLEFLFPGEKGPMPPMEYAVSLVYAVWKNDPILLMKVLDSQDVNPWDVTFVNDGLSWESPDQHTLVEFAARNKSWGCVAVLIQHYYDCRQGNIVGSEMSPVLIEYENATDPDRIAYAEGMMRALNKGVASYLATQGSLDAVHMPAHLNYCHKSCRFLFKDFSMTKFGNKKTVGPIENKRLDLRQKAMFAISVGDVKALGETLDILKINAVAYEAAKRQGHDSLTTSEMNSFISAALSCGHTECAVKIIAKAVEFKKAESWASAARKKIDGDYLKVLVIEDAKEQFEMISNMAKDVDLHQNAANSTPASEIQAAIGKAISSVLITVDDMGYINEVKKRSEESLTVMKDCVIQACARAASQIEKMEIESSLPANTEMVSLPRERVRL